MTKPARNPKDVEKIKDTIVDQAVDILSDGGFDSLTMRRIASVTGMSATNLYNYFSNKDEIYISVLIKGFQKLYLDFQSISDFDADPLEKGRKLLRAYLDFGIENSHYYDIMFTRPVPKYNDYVGTPLESLAGIEMDYSSKIIQISMNTISDIISKKQLKPDKQDMSLRLLKTWAMLHGLIVLYNSRVMTYVAEDPNLLFESVITDILNNF